MTILEISQIIFNFSISVAAIVVTILVCIIAWDIIKIIKSTKKFANNISKESLELYEKISEFMAGIFSLLPISKLFNKKKKKK